MKFTDRSLIGLKTKNHAYDTREQDGFVIRVYPSGRKVFQFVYRQGKERRITIGEYPKVYTLKQARVKHTELYSRMKRGESHADLSRETENALTINKLATRYLEEYSKINNTERRYKDHKHMLNNDVLPLIGDRDPETVKRIDIQTCLKRCIDREAPIAFNNTLNVVRKMFNWGIEQGLIENNPAYMIKAQPTNEKSRILSDQEIINILSDKSNDSAKILNLVLLTGARPGECQAMTYEKINDDWWTCKQIKGGKTSEKKTYLVKSAKELIGNGSGLVFPNQQTQAGISKYVKRKYHKENFSNWTPHDIRRTVATRLKMMGYPHENITALLGHSFGKISRTYMVYDYENEKREMLLAWEKELEKLMQTLSMAERD